MMYMRPSHLLLRKAIDSCPRVPFSPRSYSTKSLEENDCVNPNFCNKNPRNMEMLRLARKPQGWELEASPPTYLYKLVLRQNKRNTTGWVEHYTGTVVVSASTREWAIRQHLYSAVDVSAVKNIAHVLAQRCLQSGITEVTTYLKNLQDSSEKVHIFLSTVREGGINLDEGETISEVMLRRSAKFHPVLPWQVLEDEVLREDKIKEVD